MVLPPSLFDLSAGLYFLHLKLSPSSFCQNCVIWDFAREFLAYWWSVIAITAPPPLPRLAARFGELTSSLEAVKILAVVVPIN